MVTDSTLPRLADLSPIRKAITAKERSNPWLTAKDRYAVGARFKAIVVNVNRHGVFAEMEPGITGLVHSSRLPANFGQIDAIGVGEEIEVRVLQVNSARQKIRLDVASPSVPPAATD